MKSRSLSFLLETRNLVPPTLTVAFPAPIHWQSFQRLSANRGFAQSARAVTADFARSQLTGWKAVNDPHFSTEIADPFCASDGAMDHLLCQIAFYSSGVLRDLDVAAEVSFDSQTGETVCGERYRPSVFDQHVRGEGPKIYDTLHVLDTEFSKFRVGRLLWRNDDLCPESDHRFAAKPFTKTHNGNPF